ncbi:MAG: EF-P beta-lysylation protein EpmB [Halioglobus sp.]|nr:EF-P beta-lysylation protein EpmB [Halioglobus sp.]
MPDTVHSSGPAAASGDWQEQLRNVVTRADQLLELLGLDPAAVGYCEGAASVFALKVPRSFVRRMRPGDPRDPLLLQVLAQACELRRDPLYLRDPVGEIGRANPQAGVIHKYRGRVLLIVSGGCAVNCRYCFRRHFPYGDNQNSRLQWRDTLRYVARDQSITEVILSGGDPLVATDQTLAELVAQIGAMTHVHRVRIHSRVPIVLPDRVTDSLLHAIRHPRLQTVMVLHCNHANEIDETVVLAMDRFRRRGIHLLNQAVLLAGVNDSVQAQVDLSERLFDANILPYYLHLLDKVEGAAHFDVSEQRAKELIAAVIKLLPGYLVPKLVREIPGEASKTRLG